MAVLEGCRFQRAGLDGSPVLKDTFAYYTKHKPSPDIVSQLSPVEILDSTAKPVNHRNKSLRMEYSNIAPSVVSVSSFYGTSGQLRWNCSRSKSGVLPLGVCSSWMLGFRVWSLY